MHASRIKISFMFYFARALYGACNLAAGTRVASSLITLFPGVLSSRDGPRGRAADAKTPYRCGESRWSVTVTFTSRRASRFRKLETSRDRRNSERFSSDTGNILTHLNGPSSRENVADIARQPHPTVQSTITMS